MFLITENGANRMLVDEVHVFNLRFCEDRQGRVSLLHEFCGFLAPHEMPMAIQSKGADVLISIGFRNVLSDTGLPMSGR
jgi:hypothetical protein